MAEQNQEALASYASLYAVTHNARNCVCICMQLTSFLIVSVIGMARLVLA